MHTRAFEASFQRNEEFVRRTDADKAGAADGIAVADQSDRFVSGHNLVFHGGDLKWRLGVCRTRALRSGPVDRLGREKSSGRSTTDGARIGRRIERPPWSHAGR